MSIIGKLFGTGDNPPDATKLDGTTEAALARSLSALSPDQRGWITFAEARNLFSTKGAQYAFGETDEDGRKNIESFAAQHQSVFNFMPLEEAGLFRAAIRRASSYCPRLTAACSGSSLASNYQLISTPIIIGAWIDRG